MNFPVKPLIREIEELARLGFDYIEISMDPPEAPPAKIRELKNVVTGAIQKHGLGLIAHMPTFVSIADLCERIRRASVEETVAAVKTASELGIEKVVLHPPPLMGLAKFSREKATQYGFSSLRTILGEAKSSNLTVCMENMFPRTGSFAIPGEFRTLLEEFPELSMTLDVGHAFLAGGLRNVLEFISVFGDRIHHVHANDNFGRVDSHLPVGAGLIDFARIAKELRDSGYDDTMTVEVFSRDREYLRMSRDKLERLWDEVE